VVSTFAPDEPLLSGTPTGEVSDAIALIGLWQVTDAQGEIPGTWLRIGAGIEGMSYYLFRQCGYLTSSWAASDLLFVVNGIGGSQNCFERSDGSFAVPTVDWLTSARGFRVVAGGAGDAVDLLDASGAVVAHLEPGVGSPPPSPDVWSELLKPPVIDSDVRANLRRAAPLPEGLVAATADELVGSWVVVPNPGDPPVASPPSMPGITPPPGIPDVASITLRADGTFVTASCHGAVTQMSTEGDPDSAASSGSQPGLPWSGDGSDFLVPAYGRDLMLCSPSWNGFETRARTIALDNGYLRLFDVDGAELQRWERA
jgi:hypothetical protein